MTNRDLVSLIGSSASEGLCAMSKDLPSCQGRPLYDVHEVVRWCLLRVELDDVLFLDRGVDDLTGRHGVDQDAHPVGDDLDPGRDRTAAGLGAGDDERRHLHARRTHLDDVVLADEERRDVDLLAIDQEVAVLDQLAGHVTAVREAGAVDDVVEPTLEQLEKVLAGLAGPPVGFLVVAAELLLEHAVDARALLLLPLLQEVLGVLGATATVLTRRVRPDLDRALRRLALAALEEQLHLLAAATTAVRACVSRHLRLSAASEGGIRCGELVSRRRSCRPPGRPPAATGSRSRGRSRDPSRKRRPCACRAPARGERRPLPPSARRTASTCGTP